MSVCVSVDSSTGFQVLVRAIVTERVTCSPLPSTTPSAPSSGCDTSSASKAGIVGDTSSTQRCEGVADDPERAQEVTKLVGDMELTPWGTQLHVAACGMSRHGQGGV